MPPVSLREGLVPAAAGGQLVPSAPPPADATSRPPGLPSPGARPACVRTALGALPTPGPKGSPAVLVRHGQRPLGWLLLPSPELQAWAGAPSLLPGPVSSCMPRHLAPCRGAGPAPRLPVGLGRPSGGPSENSLQPAGPPPPRHRAPSCLCRDRLCAGVGSAQAWAPLQGLGDLRGPLPGRGACCGLWRPRPARWRGPQRGQSQHPPAPPPRGLAVLLRGLDADFGWEHPPPVLVTAGAAGPSPCPCGGSGRAVPSSGLWFTVGLSPSVPLATSCAFKGIASPARSTVLPPEFPQSDWGRDALFNWLLPEALTLSFPWGKRLLPLPEVEIDTPPRRGERQVHGVASLPGSPPRLAGSRASSSGIRYVPERRA